MGMLDKFLQLLRPPGQGLSEEARRFIESIATAEIWILAIGIRGTPECPHLFDDAAIELLADHRINVSEIGEEDSLFPFNFEDAGSQLLPFFTTEEGAKQFASSWGRQSIHVFQPCPLLAGFVASPPNDDFDLVLNPRTAEERKITQEERRLLRALSVAAQRDAG
jgi:hypothetical protein